MYQILTELCTKFGDDWSFSEETYKGMDKGMDIKPSEFHY